MLGVNTVPLPCSQSNNMIPDVADAEALITRNTRAVVLISPNNPTGQEYPPSVVDQFYQLCKANNISLIIDETYRDFRENTSTPPHSIFTDTRWNETAIHLYSFSKAYALAGYRVGVIAAAPAFLTEVTKVLDCITICAPQLSQRAALFALQNAQDWKQEKCNQMHGRASAFRTAIEQHNHGYQITAMGAYFAYLEHPFEQTSTEVARFLCDHANLLTLPGEMFGPGQRKHLRVAFANVKRKTFPELANRLVEYSL